MLPDKYKLKKRSAFAATYRTGKSFHKDGITLFVGKEKSKTNSNSTKIGFVVSKKIHKRAVRRNRIKRLMRESIRLYLKQLNNEYDSKYMSLIFAASTRLLDKDFNSINKTMINLMGNINND